MTSNKKQDTLRQRTSKRKTDEETTASSDPQPRYKERKQLPSVSDLLAYGPEETRGQPKTWADILCLPVTLAVLFAISLIIFHHAPHHLSQRRSHTLPKVVQSLQEQRLERQHRRKQLQENRLPQVEEVEPLEKDLKQE